MSEKKLSEFKMPGIEHYAEVFYQKGFGVYDIETQTIAERALEQIEFRQGACGFKLFDKGLVQKTVKGNSVKLFEERINKSCFTHIGEFLTLEQVGNECGKDSREYTNLNYSMTQGRGGLGAVKTPDGYYNIFYRGDQVIDPSQIKYVDQRKEQDNGREM